MYRVLDSKAAKMESLNFKKSPVIYKHIQQKNQIIYECIKAED